MPRTRQSPWLYGVFTGTKFAMTLDRDAAMNLARKEGGTVRRLRNDPSITFDAATFKKLSNPIPVDPLQSTDFGVGKSIFGKGALKKSFFGKRRKGL